MVNYYTMKKIVITEEDKKHIMGLYEEETDDDVVVDETKIDSEDLKCFVDVSAEEAKTVGLNHGGKYKVKKKGCRTKVKYKGPKIKYYGNNGF